jgi:hypothetical protein
MHGHGHGHSLVVIVNTADKLGEVGFDVPHRQHGNSQKYDQSWRIVERWPLSWQIIGLGRSSLGARSYTNLCRRPFLCSKKGLWPW